AQALADAARLVRLVERGLSERGADVAALQPREPAAVLAATAAASASGTGRDVAVSCALQCLWAEVIMADNLLWRRVLSAPECTERDELIASTGYCRMLAWRSPGMKVPVAGAPGSRLFPRSAALEELCGARPELQHLAPALRLGEIQ
ncbi:unnamed protein product, partial [Polarella glacialis]